MHIYARTLSRVTSVLTAKECPAGMVYSSCVSKCPRTCSTLYSIQSSDCQGDCYPGCECPEVNTTHSLHAVRAKMCAC